MTDAEMIEKLKEAHKRFHSLEAMAAALRSYPGFKNLDKSTISRWLWKPSQRTEMALNILDNQDYLEPEELDVVESTLDKLQELYADVFSLRRKIRLVLRQQQALLKFRQK